MKSKPIGYLHEYGANGLKSAAERGDMLWGTACHPSKEAYGDKSFAVFDSAEFDRIRGEHVVLINLLRQALEVVKTVDGADSDECEMLMNLQNYMTNAIHGAELGLIQ